MHNHQPTHPQQRSLFLRLLTYSLPHKARFSTAFIMLAVAVGAEMTIPWLAKVIIDEVIVPQHFEWRTLGLLSGSVFALYVFSAGFQYLQAFAFRHGALLVVNDVRQQLFDHIIALPIRKFDNLPSGKLVSYLTNDTEALRDMFVSTVPTILQGSLRLIGIFIAIALLDWRLMILSLVLIPVLLLTMHGYRKVSMPIFDGIRQQVSNINNQINESLQGMALIQAFRQETAFKDKFEQSNQSWFMFRTRSIAIDSLMLAPFTRLVGGLATIAIVGWFGQASLTAVLEIGTLYAFLNYIERFFEPFRMLSMELRKLQVASASAKRIFELLDEHTEQNTPSTEFVPLASDKDIEFRNVSFGYEAGRNALSNISFTAQGGKFTAIVGHSGSGKSSLINVLMRFYQHQSGEILIGGEKIESLPEAQLRRLMGLVSQDPYLFNGSLLDNIDLSHREPNLAVAMEAAKKVKASTFIERLPNGYTHQPGFGGALLSVGERQLLALARALAHDPHIFLLDEATANIDSESEEAVKAALANIQRGRTVIAVAHRLSTIRNADHILVMSKGQIVQQGTHDELVGVLGEYRELYLAQKAKEETEHENNHLGLVTASVSE
ncbi:ABC transporter ATP-binding protein [Photobacterium nomapromontoriensis]|uniref:ABC transporter ATP-binding protein n=1 Tax=Photobacterium nomapromontoriensis TaxID=2910237 RepID=UPI003D11C03A